MILNSLSGHFKTIKDINLTQEHQSHSNQLLEIPKYQNNNLKGKYCLISGATRGIGLEIAKYFVRHEINIIILGKTDLPHKQLPHTLLSAKKEIENNRINDKTKVFAQKCDVRNESEIQSVFDDLSQYISQLDFLICNASAIKLKDTMTISMKDYDLMHNVNARGTQATIKQALHLLKKSQNPHVLVNSPPLNMQPDNFTLFNAQAQSKYGMSMCVLGMCKEFLGDIAFNSLWPKTTIATSAIKHEIGGDEMMKRSRTELVQAEAALCIMKCDKVVSGNFFIDDEVLKSIGVEDFNVYKVDQNIADDQLINDGFI